ncbi:hypothetical protein [Paraburkholderia sp. LEh10]|uniref:hypothetical protein n=1 Tax=Paraburkholderia sp. LEh10 TaxID=2821353 RepID=UPI0039180B49
MKYLYMYPKREYPYRDLIETNRMRSRNDFEYELFDTGVFDDDRYFYVFVEHAKAGPEDMNWASIGFISAARWKCFSRKTKATHCVFGINPTRRLM